MNLSRERTEFRNAQRFVPASLRYASPVGRQPARERLDAFILEKHAALVSKRTGQQRVQNGLPLPWRVTPEFHQALQIPQIVLRQV